MIKGMVREIEGGLHPNIIIPVQDGDGSFHPLEATVDTGFTGALTMPPSFIEGLGLARRGNRTAFLADGAAVQFQAYRATILWHGVMYPVTAFESDGGALIGMQLLRDSRLLVEAWEGGAVIIEEAE